MLLELSGGIACAVGVMAWGVRGRSSTWFGPSVCHGARDRSSIALTFDDGPSEATPRLLDILAEYRAPATFFQCGANVRRLPEIARQVAAAGHQVGNHSDTHSMFAFRSAAFIGEELRRAQESIAEAAGAAPSLFRAPYGVRWFGLRQAQQRLGLLGVMWSALGRDWKLSAARIASRLLGTARNGAIFCLHDGREIAPAADIGTTLEAVRRVVPELLERGYRFETVSQLLCPKS